ncbi:hypothetical protein L1987_24094 [Smallanthus sonchifolius]|uniref:Uncharacterized protein n=1 Tax=Smallanthus sonchifolius TaxID=185202 RepID=A0ACB9IIQ8_9ASTR|nr:hypothetical protein L1987_24094 [Smallanthus sonchifolius]
MNVLLGKWKEGEARKGRGSPSLGRLCLGSGNLKPCFFRNGDLSIERRRVIGLLVFSIVLDNSFDKESAIGGGANGIHTEHSPIRPRTANFVHCLAMNESESSPSSFPGYAVRKRKRGSALVPTVTALDNSKPGRQLCSPKSSAYLGDQRQFSVDRSRSLPNQLQSFLGVGKVKWGHPSPLSALPRAIDIIRQAYLKMCFRAHISKFQRNAFLTVRTSVPEAKKEEQEQEAFIHVMAKDFADRSRLGLVLRFDKRKMFDATKTIICPSKPHSCPFLRLRSCTVF